MRRHFIVKSSPWHYYCDGGLCKKAEITENVTTPLALSVCQLFCGEAGAIWPKPTGHMSFGNFVARLDPDDIVLSGIDLRSNVGQLLQENVDRLKENVKTLPGSKAIKKGYGLTINVDAQFDVTSAKLTLGTSEAYTIAIHQQEDGELIADVSGKNYFGVRHALETLSQLIVYDDLYGDVKIVRDVYIKDEPAFPYRGILLDTARNFMDKASILRTIEAMAMSKMNTFHWHITDSHSFPYVSRTWPKFSKYGAYTPDKIYTEQDIKEIVKFGLVRGVRVLPEFDAPAHVGEGWQWVGHDTTVCFKAEPWQRYCVEPPCGQLNPTSEKVYEVLEGIFTDMMRDFEPDFFHMGGDEVNINCWNSSDIIKDWMTKKGWDLSESSFYQLWDHFQSKAYDKLTKANNGKELDAVLWTSGLTNEENLKHLDPKKYIIQIWTTGADATIGRLIKNNFRVIFSNYDALYLDCGFGAWVGEGNNWCAPYKGWQKVYENSPMKMLKGQGFSEQYKHLVLGGEAALWSEQVDSTSVDSRLWPRSAAMAERLWSNPTSSWIHAEQRMLRHRERLVQRGIFADSLEPEWCLQNQGSCYL
ncbi:chitooligosaccharidolytic beta-N-acetylglucosaminidase isoform X2 [Nasonia vitripennis]|uniref:Beta-hexosaminidase n=1 Tax=Nasonia vitripennis TaxID=7425 RepID=A0A7M7QFG4_NASVI|nr:chitooligosaccharidolytic beta-N-acetylglucosaminidase isoform X2 [Nasonia vitripennis]